MADDTIDDVGAPREVMVALRVCVAGVPFAALDGMTVTVSSPYDPSAFAGSVPHRMVLFVSPGWRFAIRTNGGSVPAKASMSAGVPERVMDAASRVA